MKISRYKDLIMYIKNVSQSQVHGPANPSEHRLSTDDALLRVGSGVRYFRRLFHSLPHVEVRPRGISETRRKIQSNYNFRRI